MGDITKEFNGMSLFGKWVALTGAFANHFASVSFWMAHLKFHVLSFSGRFNKLSLDLETRANSGFRNLSEVGNRAVNNHLKSASATSVSQLNESEVFAAHASGSRPASNLDDVV
jgi:hypothetical protein